MPLGAFKLNSISKSLAIASSLTGWIGTYGIANIADQTGGLHFYPDKSVLFRMSRQEGSINFGSIVKVGPDGELVSHADFAGSDANVTINLQDLAVDSSGNIYICGYDTTLQKIFVAKLNSLYQIIWSKSVSGDSTTIGSQITLDNSNNVYVSGYSNKLSLGYGTNAVVLKFNSSGTLQWQKMLTTTVSATEQFTTLAIDSNQNIILLGYANSAGGEGLNDVYIVKYNSSGILQWQKSIGSSLSDTTGTALEIDSSDNIYIRMSTTASPASGSDPVIIKLNSSGQIIWQKMFQFSTGTESIGSINFDGSSLWLSGTLTNTDIRAIIVNIDLNGNILSQKTFDVLSFSDGTLSLEVEEDYFRFATSFTPGAAAYRDIMVGKFSKGPATDGTYTLGTATIVIGSGYSMTSINTNFPIKDRTITEYTNQLTDDGNFTLTSVSKTINRIEYITLPS